MVYGLLIFIIWRMVWTVHAIFQDVFYKYNTRYHKEDVPILLHWIWEHEKIPKKSSFKLKFCFYYSTSYFNIIKNINKLLQKYLLMVISEIFRVISQFSLRLLLLV